MLEEFSGINLNRDFKPNINRDNLFADSYNYLKHRKAQEMNGKIEIKFIGEPGQDEGGLTKEWFQVISQQIMNPNYSLFKANDVGNVYYPNQNSFINPYH